MQILLHNSKNYTGTGIYRLEHLTVNQRVLVSSPRGGAKSRSLLIGFFVLHDLDEKFILSEMKWSRRKSKRSASTSSATDLSFLLTDLDEKPVLSAMTCSRRLTILNEIANITLIVP